MTDHAHSAVHSVNRFAVKVLTLSILIFVAQQRVRVD